MSDGPRIGIDPIPPAIGQEVTFTAGPNMTIVVEYEGHGSVVLTTDSEGKVTDVVTGGYLLVVSDPDGVWQSNTSMIS